jgi:bacterioferritin
MNTKVVDLLNKAVRDELSAIHQYLYFHFHCDDQALPLLAGLFKRTAIEEMQHVEKLAERILFLQGDVDMAADQPLKKVKSVPEMLKLARQMEIDSIKEYNESARECTSHNDAISRQLLESLAADEERHSDQFGKESENLGKFGDNYLALQSLEHAKSLLK